MDAKEVQKKYGISPDVVKRKFAFGHMTIDFANITEPQAQRLLAMGSPYVSAPKPEKQKKENPITSPEGDLPT